LPLSKVRVGGVAIPRAVFKDFMGTLPSSDMSHLTKVCLQPRVCSHVRVGMCL
jgi:hypothetical protein